MLFKISSTGRKFQVTKIPYEKEYLHNLSFIEEGKFEIIKEYIYSKILTSKSFAVGTLFGKINGDTDWHRDHPPLDYVYQAMERKKSKYPPFIESANLVGLIVLDLLINDELSWGCSDFDLGHRGYEVNFYWKA